MINIGDLVFYNIHRTSNDRRDIEIFCDYRYVGIVIDINERLKFAEFVCSYGKFQVGLNYLKQC